MNNLMVSDPDNKYVIIVMRSGVQNVEKLHTDTPSDVARYRKQMSNQFHMGQGDTLAEIFEGIPRAQSAWHAFMLANHIKTDLCPAKGPLSFAKVRAILS